MPLKSASTPAIRICPPFLPRTSIATTTHWEPNFSLARRTSSGSLTAAEFREILSAPAFKISRISSRERMPPPTVNGMKTCSATLLTISTTVPLPSTVAEISRKTSSSAPAWLYALAHSTGSPASRSAIKFVPFTTRPFLTSRHGMILLLSICRHPFFVTITFLSALPSGSGSQVLLHRSFPGGTGRQRHCLF